MNATYEQFAEVIRFLAFKGYSPGTGGNFSLVLSRDPLRLVMSPSGIDKGQISPEQLIVVDQYGKVIQGTGKASAETAIHITIASKYGANCILHTHSVWNTLLSMQTTPYESVNLTGFEMLKALGEQTHQTTVKIPVFPNTQDIECFAGMLDDEFEQYKSMKGFLMAGHGLYTWGDTLYCAKRHVEALEFLFEVVGNQKLLYNVK
jgi:methylthioribulose-1-phosphate dehydratase